MSVFSGSVQERAAAPFLRLRPWGCAAPKGGVPLRGRAAAKGRREAGPVWGPAGARGRRPWGAPPQKGIPLRGRAAAKGAARSGARLGARRGQGQAAVGERALPPKGGCRGKGGAGGVLEQKTDKKFRKPSLSRPGSCDIISKSGVFSKN